MTEAKRYRKKPVVIEAMRWPLPIAPTHEQALHEAWERAQKIAAWCRGKAFRDEMPGQELKTYYWTIQIVTLEGVMSAQLGDYIIKGVNGEFYPCKPDVFAKTYEQVANPIKTVKRPTGTAADLLGLDDTGGH